MNMFDSGGGDLRSRLHEEGFLMIVNRSWEGSTASWKLVEPPCNSDNACTWYSSPFVSSGESSSMPISMLANW